MRRIHLRYLIGNGLNGDSVMRLHGFFIVVDVTRRLSGSACIILNNSRMSVTQ
ncbi:hypothetical protein ACT691_17075 [Vibrio metschnikovii]